MKVFSLTSSMSTKTSLKRRPSQEKPTAFLILLLLPLRQTEHSLSKVVIFRGCIYFGVYGRFSTPQGSILRFYRLSSRNILLLLNIPFRERNIYTKWKIVKIVNGKRKDLFREVRCFRIFFSNKIVNLNINSDAHLINFDNRVKNKLINKKSHTFFYSLSVCKIMWTNLNLSIRNISRIIKLDGKSPQSWKKGYPSHPF